MDEYDKWLAEEFLLDKVESCYLTDRLVALYDYLMLLHEYYEEVNYNE